MKILYLASNLDSAGGISRYNRALFSFLREKNAEVLLLELKKRQLVEKIRFVLKIIGEALFFAPDIIVCSHVNFSSLCLFLKKIFGKNYIVLTYGIEVWNIKKKIPLRALREANLIVAISSYTKDKLVRQLPDIGRKIFILNNSVDGREFFIKRKSKDLINKYKLGNSRVILTVARLSSEERYKGYDKVIESLPLIIREIPEVKYLLVGGGDDIKRIQGLIADWHLENHVILAGYVNNDEIVDYYNLCDVFAMPSAKEGFGFVFLEALACGKPVVAGNRGGAAEAVLDGELGILVNPDSVDDVADAIAKTLRGETPAHFRDGDYLRGRVLEKYGWERFEEGVGRLLSSLSGIDSGRKIDGIVTERPSDFVGPTYLPASAESHRIWQSTILAWWEEHPMRYDWRQEISPPEFSKDFYREIDSRFFSNAREYLPDEKIPFDSLVDFDSLRGSDVLEIGIGNGSHAQLLARHAKSFTGIDITNYSVKSVKRRFEIFDLKGEIVKMDAEKLTFPDDSFDLIWSWGVIDHSANTPNIVREMTRVLRSGGKAVTMVYYRGWWNYYCIGFLKALLSGDLLRTKSLHKSVQLRSDGPIARYYTIKEWQVLVKDFFSVSDVKILGPKTDVIPLPRRKMTTFLFNFLPRRYNRFLADKFRMGSFLVTTLKSFESRDGLENRR